MTAPREGSRKRQVFDQYVAQGADKAEVFGLTLGLKSGTIRSWIGTWSKDGGTDVTPAHVRSATAIPGRRKVEIYPGTPGDKWIGIVIAEGPEVSAVRMVEAPERLLGLELNIPNDLMVRIKNVETTP
jgi:hypothetical protein